MLTFFVGSVLVPIPMSRPVLSSQQLKKVLLPPSVLTTTCNSSVRLKIVEKPTKKVSKKNSKIRRNLCLNTRLLRQILAADYANFEREIKRLEATGAEYAHIDIMVWSLCTTISFGAGVVEALRPHSKMVFDCH